MPSTGEDQLYKITFTMANRPGGPNSRVRGHLPVYALGEKKEKKNPLDTSKSLPLMKSGKSPLEEYISYLPDHFHN